MHKRLLCRTLAGNRVDLLTITNPSILPEDYAKRKGIFLTARVHPGESVGSWMLKGVMDFLVSDCYEAN